MSILWDVVERVSNASGAEWAGVSAAVGAAGAKCVDLLVSNKSSHVKTLETTYVATTKQFDLLIAGYRAQVDTLVQQTKELTDMVEAARDERDAIKAELDGASRQMEALERKVEALTRRGGGHRS